MPFAELLASPVGKTVVSGILSGLGGLFGGKSKRKQAEQDQKNQLALNKQNVELTGAENRKTCLYETQLAAAAEEYNRARKRGAFKNFGFAVPNDPYAASAMQGYEQVWKPEDTKLNLPNVPGATSQNALPVTQRNGR